jgi:hypothetical protein
MVRDASPNPRIPRFMMDLLPSYATDGLLGEEGNTGVAVSAIKEPVTEAKLGGTRPATMEPKSSYRPA